VSANFNVSPSPHIRDRVKSSNIMLFVVIALLPATFFGIYNFRHENAWLLVLVTTASAVLAEYIYEKLMHKPVTIQDFSAVVTGLLLALNLPPTLPLWMGALGSVFAIIVVKQLFGGLGQNFMNPALGARCFLLISFTGKMTYFVYDGVTGPTPLANLRAGEAVNPRNNRRDFCDRDYDRCHVLDPDGRDRSSDSGNLYRNICNLYHSVRRSWL
jgi:Na+-translocating ferredoxin:NAD+ oxidoreductase RnfD subunit